MIPDHKTVTCELDHFVVVADQLQLERLLTNLLTNAYRYGGSGIRITAESKEGHVVTAVSDNGDGVPEGVGRDGIRTICARKDGRNRRRVRYRARALSPDRRLDGRDDLV